jgi:aminoglycoside 6-adenylyltransferase
VDNLESFISDKSWTNIFGDKLIWQLPDDMVVGKKDPEKSSRFALLIRFTDGNRIDLTLLSKTEIKANYKPDSLTIVWLDKDNMFSNIGLPNDSDYLVKEPTEKEFLDTCNEFWWVCTYVAKGLTRNEIIYSKEILEDSCQANVYERHRLAYRDRNKFFSVNRQRKVYEKPFTSRFV